MNTQALTTRHPSSRPSWPPASTNSSLICPVGVQLSLPMLLYAQDEVGYLSDPVIAEIAARIGITELDVRNVISYYSLLRTKPSGKYHVQVCTNISCMLRGGNEILEHCKKTLRIANKGVTSDGMFSLEEVECIGACSGRLPAQVNATPSTENLTPESIDKVIADYRDEIRW